MKNIHIERLRLAAKLYHRNNQSEHFERGIVVRHLYNNPDPHHLTWWDDVTFILNDYRVVLSWMHPRQIYQDMIEEQARRRVAHIPVDDLFLDSVPVYKKLGRSRKKVSVWQSSPMAREWIDAYSAEYARLSREADYKIALFLKAGWCCYARRVELCAPVEVRNEDDLRALALLAKRLLKRETSLELEFPGYRYTRDHWIADGLASGECKLHAHKIG